MKQNEKKFLKPMAEIVEFCECDDIITTSIGDEDIPWYEQ